MSESVFIEDNNSISIKGAKKVVSSTQNQAVVETSTTTIVITGANIEVKKLDLDNEMVVFCGKTSNVKFSSLGGSKQPLLKRIFK